MKRPEAVDERALVAVPRAIADGGAVEDIVLAAGGREAQPVAPDDGVEVVYGVRVPLAGVVGAVEGDGEGEEGDPADGVDDGELRGGGGAPGEVDEGDLLGAGDEVAPGGLAELPRAVVGVAAEVAELDGEVVVRYGGDGASFGPGDASGAG